MSKAMAIMLGYLVAALLVGQALADLHCKDYIPLNWTTPRARINVVSGRYPSEKFLPTNMSATSPWTFAKQSEAGVIFNLKTCNSTSLNKKSSVTVTCNNDGTGCFKDYIDYVQIIHPSTGHCLTNQHYSANYSLAVWQPCNPNPTTLYQLWVSDRGLILEEECCFSPGPVADWNACCTSMIPPYKPTGDNYFSWLYTNDNKTVALERYSYPTIQMSLVAVDRLTNK